MEHGREFEFTEEELDILASKLINNEIDPINQIKKRNLDNQA